MGKARVHTTSTTMDGTLMHLLTNKLKIQHINERKKCTGRGTQLTSVKMLRSHRADRQLPCILLYAFKRVLPITLHFYNLNRRVFNPHAHVLHVGIILVFHLLKATNLVHRTLLAMFKRSNLKIKLHVSNLAQLQTLSIPNIVFTHLIKTHSTVRFNMVRV